MGVEREEWRCWRGEEAAAVLTGKTQSDRFLSRGAKGQQKESCRTGGDVVDSPDRRAELICSENTDRKRHEGDHWNLPGTAPWNSLLC